ncbi:outer membrane beta-barrel protein [Dysgonomonas sp. BGC7]|uniref:outer membrane beta-barrel protein n=1 Tax=Dysgonomonas sp. BGC7 TaxID=1658008 RepID=UPI0006819A01|nr:outer membrane beta-barrel protein [Dysgonomonas sp. BGC7]MBD8387605.1 outer membrane beta-barrel protein [Dysgonomonas sp. BGC7]
MRKLFLVGALALSTLFVSAQDGLQGKWFVGGQLGFGSSKDNKTALETKTTSFNVVPMVGTFISPSVAVGAGLGYTSSKVKVAGEQTRKTNGFEIAPFARKYWNIAGGLYFFGEAALPVSFGSTEGANSDSKSNSTAINIALAPGFDYIINDWISIETKFNILTAGYNSDKPKGGTRSDSFGFNGNTHQNEFGDLTIGVKFLF